MTPSTTELDIAGAGILSAPAKAPAKRRRKTTTRVKKEDA